MDRAREWALRCSHEAQMHTHNQFVTLTFDNKNFPADGSVSKRHVQLFLKRLRFAYSDKIVRFFASAEYSPIHNRPHYHLLLFNQLFEDQTIHSYNRQKQAIYKSTILQKLWPFGFSTTAAVNYQTARYCAQYALKKITGDLAPDHYTWPHPLHGYSIRVQPEFALMSRRPGLGSTWYDRFKADCYPSDFLIVDGKKHPIPKYYDNKLKKEALAELERHKRARKVQSNKQRSNNTPERLAVREEILTEKLKRSQRNEEIK